MKLGMHKLAPIPPTIFQNEVIWMKNIKMRAKIASQSLKYTPPLFVYDIVVKSIKKMLYIKLDTAIPVIFY